MMLMIIAVNSKEDDAESQEPYDHSVHMSYIMQMIQYRLFFGNGWNHFKMPQHYVCFDLLFKKIHLGTNVIINFHN